MTPVNPPSINDESDLDWDLLDRYLAGQCDASESARAVSMFERHPVVHQTMQQFLQTLDPADGVPTPTEKAELAQRLRQQIAAPHVPAKRPVIGHTQGRFRSWRTSWIGAAAACAVLGAGLYAVRHQSTTESGSDRVYATNRGERITVHLPDGSLAMLGAQSKIHYGTSFDRDDRNVYLEGEAYFAVAGRSAKPFVVYTAKTAAQVLGTEFFVKAYATDDVRMAVTDGKVMFRSRASAPNAGATLTRGDVATIGEQGVMTVARGGSVEPYVAWSQGRLPFVHAQVRDVIEDLERWYNVTIVVDDPKLANATVSFTLDKESADQALSLLADIIHASCTRSGNVITLTPNRRT